MQIVAHRAIAVSIAFQRHLAIGQRCNCPSRPDYAQWHRTINLPMLSICCDSFETGLRPQISSQSCTPPSTPYRCVAVPTSLDSVKNVENSRKNHFRSRKTFFRFPPFFRFFIIKKIENRGSSEFKNKTNFRQKFSLSWFFVNKYPPAAWLLLFFSLSGATQEQGKKWKVSLEKFRWKFRSVSSEKCRTTFAKHQ